MTDTKEPEAEKPEEKQLSVEEKLDILNAQIGFLIQAMAEQDERVQGLDSFIRYVFTLASPREEGPDVEQSQS